MTISGYSSAVVDSMLGWLKGLANWVLRLFNLAGSVSGSPLLWLSENWLKLLIFLIIVGLGVDLLVWLIRWRPYWLWFGKKRRILDDTQDITDAPQRQDSARRQNAPHFKSAALPRTQIAHPEEDFVQDDLFDVVSAEIMQAKEPPAQTKLVGVSVNQYIDTASGNSKEKKQAKEIEWFD